MSAPQQANHRLPGHGGRDSDGIPSNQFPVRTFSAPPGDAVDANRPIYAPYKSGAAGGYNPGPHGHSYQQHQHPRGSGYVPRGVPTGEFRPGQPFIPRGGAPQPHHVTHEQGHDPNVNPPQHPHHHPGQGQRVGHNQQPGGLGRPPNRGPNPNVAPFVPQSMQHAPQLPQQSGYNPRHQQPYYAMQGGYGAAPPPHMYAPHLNQAHLPYPPMQMGLNPSLGLGVPGLAPPTAPPPVVPPPREKKAMLIIDPRTQKPINECLAEPSDKKANPPKATSTLRAASKEFVMPSAVPVASHISPPIPPSSPIVHKEATPLSPKPHPKSPTSKPKSPVATPALSSPKSVGSPKAAATPVEPSLVFGTVELDADLLVASPTNVSLPPGFEAPAEEEEDEKQVVAPKRTITRPPNDAPAKKGKTCYSVRFLFSFREEYPTLPDSDATGWLSMEITSDGPSDRRGAARRTDRQNSGGGPPTGQLQRQSSRGNNN
ncbi:hypothetical protein AaE_003190, partial [Aphanomyces astaci]